MPQQAHKPNTTITTSKNIENPIHTHTHTHPFSSRTQGTTAAANLWQIRISDDGHLPPCFRPYLLHGVGLRRLLERSGSLLSHPVSVILLARGTVRRNGVLAPPRMRRQRRRLVRPGYGRWLRRPLLIGVQAVNLGGRNYLLIQHGVDRLVERNCHGRALFPCRSRGPAMVAVHGAAGHSR